MTKHYSFVVLGTVVLLGVLAAPHPAAAQAEASIRELPIEKWCEAEAARDLDAWMSLFTSDVVFMPPGAPVSIATMAWRVFPSPMSSARIARLLESMNATPSA